MNDISFLFNSQEYLRHFQIYLNSRHVIISFTIENEKDNITTFLDVEINRESGKLATSVYHKPPFSKVYTHLIIFCHPPTKLA